jgi:hypothetical protein
MRRTRSATTLGRPLAAYMSNGGPAIAGRHSRPAQLALQERVERVLALLATTTIVVHHRCITAQHLAVFCGIGGQGGSGWLSQIRRCGEGCGEESGLEVC